MYYQEDQDATITASDAHRLRLMLLAEAADSLDREHLENLEEDLDTASVVDPESIPGDSITLDSRVRIQDLNSGEESSYTLVIPHKADIAIGAIAITAPLGRAMFGRKVGDILQFSSKRPVGCGG